MRKSKYGNVKTHGFDSKAEYARWQELVILQKAGKIMELERQVKFPLFVGEVLVCTYVADFTYKDTGRCATFVEDVKGVRTAIYRLKKKLMLAVLGVKIKEVDVRDLRIRRAK